MDSIKQKILIIDDSPETIQMMVEILKTSYSIIVATHGEKALQLAVKSPVPDLILLDIMMPDMDGYEVCRRLKANGNTQDIPVIFVTALGEVTDETKGFELGAADYIIKPISPAIVQARVKSHLMIRGLTRSLQFVNNELINLNLFLEEKVQQRTKELRYAVYFNSLTGLPSRVSLLKDLDQACYTLAQPPEQGLALLLLDCTRFSLINNSLGHGIGDKVLIAMAERFRNCLQSGESVYHLGEDDFGFLMRGIREETDVTSFANRILHTFAVSFQVESFEIFITARIGIVIGGAGYSQAVDIIRDGDTALQKAKADRTTGYYLFQGSLHDAALKRLRLENDLVIALKREEFLLHYQPIIDFKDNRIDAFEALVRWQNPQRGMVPPMEFISCLEETGLIVSVGMFIFRQACIQLREWQAVFKKELSMSVNLAPRQLSHPGLLADIDRILEETGIDPKDLKLEVTESGLLETGTHTVDILSALRLRGIQISIDDFGTGYSSLSYLNLLPVDILKIDRAFVKDIGPQGEHSEIAQAIVSVGQALGKKIVAEGLETAEQVAHLKQLGCNFGQGYYFSRPLDAKKATELLAVGQIPKA